MSIHVEQALEHDPALLSRSLQTQMDSLIVEPLNKAFHDGGSEVTGYSKVIVLDGLDECGTPDAQQYILQVISTAVQRCFIPLVFLIASRPEHTIRESFSTAPLISITARLALDDNYRPDGDIRLFLVESFASLKRTHTLGSRLPPAWPAPKDIERLVQKSSGQFIYAATVVKFVQSPRHRPDQQLEIILGIAEPGNHTPFAALDTLYRHIFSSVEDLPRVLDILSCCFLIYSPHLFPLKVKNIEKFLGYQLGDLQILLIDLHSVLNVPDSRRKELRVLHASLQDFLMDSSRSRNFYLDKGKAHAQIVRAMIQYYQEQHSHPGDSGFDTEYDFFIANQMSDFCLKSSPTKELLCDFFNFNLQRWAIAVKRHDQLHRVGGTSVGIYSKISSVYVWFQKQESIVQEHFGPRMSLSAHHSLSWDSFIQWVLEKHLPPGYKNADIPETPAVTAHKHAVTVLTHPHFIYDFDLHSLAIAEAIFHGRFDIPTIWLPYVNHANHNDLHHKRIHSPERFHELSKFLCDPNRAGGYFVDAGMYADLSLHIGKYVLQGHKEEDENELNNSSKMALQWATKCLPFYLSKAEYTSALADYFQSHKLELVQQCSKLHWDTQPFLEAVDLYLTTYDINKQKKERNDKKRQSFIGTLSRSLMGKRKV